MSDRPARSPRTLDQVLWSVSDTLYPESLGQKPVDLNSHSPDGDTPLHVLAWRNDTEGAAILITAGADVNAMGDMGETPLHIAVRRRNTALLDLLLQAGGDPDVRSEFGLTPRDMAVRSGGKIAQVFWNM